MTDAGIGKVSVRPAVPEDTNFVRALVPQLLAFGPVPPWRDREYMVETDLEVMDRALQSRSPEAAVFVAEDRRGVRVGFIHVCDEADYYSRRPCGHIADIVVAPEARGRGVGTALIRAAEQWARDRGHALLSLNVFLENTGARAVYERCGFGAETVRYIKPI